MEIESYREEKRYLAQAVKTLDSEILRIRTLLCSDKDKAPVSGEAAVTWRRDAVERVEGLCLAQSNPYFGRIDLVSTDGDMTCYIGRKFVKGIAFSMYAPIAALYYNSTAKEYRTPKGMVGVEVELKRDIQISDGQLIRVFDTYVSKPVPGLPVRMDMRLAEALTGSKQGALPNISDTIQPEQYERIAAEPDCVLVIQGVAGSGKSEIGLHRVAYLLSPHNELGLKLTTEQVVYIGPSRAFLRYIANLLPDLAVDIIRHLTLRDWLLSTLPEPVRIESKDTLFGAQLSGRKRFLARDIIAASFKVSLKMPILLDRYVEHQKAEFVAKATELELDDVFLPATKVARLVREVPRQPLNQARTQALRTLETHICKATGRTLSVTQRERLHAKVSKFWPEVDFREAYRQLLSSEQGLLQLLAGLVPAETSKELAASLSTKAKLSFKTADLPALSYMSRIVGAREGRRHSHRRKPSLYQHIVIDEAQDVSPLELLLIRNSSRNHSITILGDLNQRLFPHRGISNWHQVTKIFGKGKVRRHYVQTSYRATFEITTFANSILRSLQPRHAMPIPYSRSGDEPSFVHSESNATMVEAIARDIDSYFTRGMKTVAVLCKTNKEAERLRKALLEIIAEHGVASWTGADLKHSGLTVSSIYDVKGMEFDAVIIANAGKRNYMASELHSRLLYIAITRAAHAISIHWFGKLAEIFTPVVHRRPT